MFIVQAYQTSQYVAPRGRNFSSLIYTVFIVQAYQTSHCVVPRGGIFLGKWWSSSAGNSNGKMNVQPACALNKNPLSLSRVLRYAWKYILALYLSRKLLSGY
jgi:hypothetical protein